MGTRGSATRLIPPLPDLWTTHPLSSGLPLFLIPELRAVSGNLRQPEVKCFAAIKPPAAFGGRLFIREALDGAAADRLELGGCVRREASTAFRLATIYRTKNIVRCTT